MAYPATERRTWQPDHTAFLWLICQTTDPDPETGMILEIGGCITRWDWEPVSWGHWLVRPPVMDWADVCRPERYAIYETNGLVEEIGWSRPQQRYWGPVEGILKVVAKLEAWWTAHSQADIVPVIAGPHAELTLRWLHRYAEKFAARCHPVGFDTFGFVEVARHRGTAITGGGPYGRSVPDVWRHLTTVRGSFGLPAPDFPADLVPPPPG